MYRPDRHEALLSNLGKHIKDFHIKGMCCQHDTSTGLREYGLRCLTIFDEVGPDWRYAYKDYCEAQRKLLRIPVWGLIKYFSSNPDLSAC